MADELKTAPGVGVVTRFAPSPTGFLHLGHAYSAMLAEGLARRTGGRFLLRIEDIDSSRCREEFERGISEDLAWLGLSWEEPVRMQSRHLDDYKTALDGLHNLGVLYPCFCTRREIAEEVARAGVAPHGLEGPVYPGTCRRLGREERESRLAQSEGGGFALRLDVNRAWRMTSGDLTWSDRLAGVVRAVPGELGDVVLARKDIGTSYHLAVTVDDALQGVNLVVRGEDLFQATHVHRLLQELLGLPTPDYLHHTLVGDESGRRYSKRDASITLRALREAGESPESVRRRLFPDSW